MKTHKSFFVVVAFVIVFLVLFFAVVQPRFFAAVGQKDKAVDKIVRVIVPTRRVEVELVPVPVGAVQAGVLQNRIIVDRKSATLV